MVRQKPADDLLIYCVGGRGEAWVEESHIRVEAGDFLLLPANLYHRYQAEPSAPWSIYWVHLGGPEVRHYFAEITEGENSYYKAAVGTHPRLTEEFQAMQAAVTRVRKEHLVYAANLLRSLLSFAALMRRQHGSRHASLDVARVNGYLQTALHRRVCLDELVAATSDLSRYHFVREYKRQTGLSPMQAFQRIKISHACYLLDITDDSVADIGARLAYDDPYYFSRLFKRVMGVSPRHYRGGRGMLS